MVTATQAPTPRDRVTEWLRRLRPLIYLGCSLAFLKDVTDTETLAFGVFYIPLVSTALLSRNRYTVWLLTGLAILLVVIGGLLPTVHPDHFELIGNRMLSIMAIFATALFVVHAQQTQLRLAEQTRRAEEAERLTAAFFTDLSNDIRVPLHAIIGLSQVMKLDCPPARRESLTHVQSTTKRLLTTIDNLVDLAQLGRRTLQRQPLDLAAELRRTVSAQRDLAGERGVSLRLHIAEITPLAIGDAWAAGRILENVIDNAVRHGRPGGSVTISMTQRNGGVVIAVSDDGAGIPQAVIAQLGQDSGALPRVGGGLLLSRQLAEAIGAELHFEPRGDSGTMVTVHFPTVPATDSEPPGDLARAE